jgi:hypothetical protein
MKSIMPCAQQKAYKKHNSSNEGRGPEISETPTLEGNDEPGKGWAFAPACSYY